MTRESLEKQDTALVLRIRGFADYWKVCMILNNIPSCPCNSSIPANNDVLERLHLRHLENPPLHQGGSSMPLAGDVLPQ